MTRREAFREFLNSPREYHATIDGFYQGVRDVKPRIRDSDSKAESHYFKFGYTLGMGVKGLVTVFVVTNMPGL